MKIKRVKLVLSESVRYHFKCIIKQCIEYIFQMVDRCCSDIQNYVPHDNYIDVLYVFLKLNHVLDHWYITSVYMLILNATMEYSVSLALASVTAIKHVMTIRMKIQNSVKVHFIELLKNQ